MARRRFSTEALARASSRHPWRVVAVWVVGLVVSGFLTQMLLADVLSNEFEFTNDPESERAGALITEHLNGGEEEPQTEPILVQAVGSARAGDPAFQDYVAELEAALEALGPEVVKAPVISYLDTADQDGDGTPEPLAPVSEDGDTAMLLLQLHEPENAAEIEAVRELLDEHARPGEFRALMAGNAALYADFSELAEEDLRKGESIGILVALVVMIVVFTAILAAIVPIVMAIFAIILAFALTSLVGQLVDFQLFVTNMITMIGLAVGIDYSLFIVSRYREERRRGRDKLAAIEASGATANRAVFFSGVTVVLALLGMMIIPTTIFRSLASGAIFVVIASLAASMTLLPALLALLGDRINWPRMTKRARHERAALASGDGDASLMLKDLADKRGGFWDRITHAVMARPVISLLLGAAFMLVAASGYLGIESGFAGVSTLPDEAKSKEAFIVLQEEFAGLFVSPAHIVVDRGTATASPEQVDAAIQRLQAEVAASDAFSERTDVITSPDGAITVVDAYFSEDPNSRAAISAVDGLREQIIPKAFEGVDAEVLVGGDTAMGADFFNLTDTYTPIVFAFVLGLSFLLLTVVFRSIVVPIKAILMNLLSVFAAYGLVTAVFQEGGPFYGKWIADLLQFQQVEAIEAWLPLFLFSVLFGLSMDYEVFLLTRIREHYDYTHDNTESVAHGLRTTGAIITGAALIMVAVFGGFAAGTVVPLKQMGFGLAVAVLFDATIVRSILVPSSMKLLGDWNWYLPKWLRWLPDVKVEGEHAPHGDELPEEEPART